MSLKRTISRTARGVFYFPKTLYLNYRCLPFKDAVKLPFIVMGSTSLCGIKKKNIKIEGTVHTGMIRVAAQKTSKRGLPVNRKTSIIVDNGGSITFCGDTSIGAGTSVCAHGGKIRLGNKFSCNINCFLYSMESIETGSDVLLGWNINIRDNDGHPLYQNGEIINPNKGVRLGDRVWIASYVDIMKGVCLADGTAVGTRSLVTKSFPQPNTLIAGSPAKIIKEDIIWDYEFDKRCLIDQVK